MIRVSSRDDLHASLASLRRPNARIGFVPTMGYLHQGHASLIQHARQASDLVVVSLFVNPKQFGPQEDLDRYPRDLDRDTRLCRESGVDLLWTPEASDIYPAGFQTEVRVTALSAPLCGEDRPGHFTGVATVVARLLGLVRPHAAFFGQKDFQQWRLIARMVEDLALGVDIVRCPIVREPDGLAMSSRNAYLTPDERLRARALSRALARAMRAYLAGERRAVALLDAARPELAEVDLQYLELRDADSLEPIAHVQAPAVLAVAAKVGSTRLIDNVLFAPDSPDRGLERLLEGASA